MILTQCNLLWPKNVSVKLISSKRNLFHHFSKICLKMALIYLESFLFLIQRKDLLFNKLLHILICKIFMTKANKSHLMVWSKLLLMKIQNTQLRNIVKLYTEKLQSVKKGIKRFLKIWNQCKQFHKMSWEGESVKSKKLKNKRSANNKRSNKDFMKRCWQVKMPIWDQV